jgi:hypothetical protein
MNLLNTLSLELQNELKYFKVISVTLECGEVSVKSEWDMDYSYYEAICQEVLCK